MSENSKEHPSSLPLGIRIFIQATRYTLRLAPFLTNLNSGVSGEIPKSSLFKGVVDIRFLARLPTGERTLL